MLPKQSPNQSIGPEAVFLKLYCMQNWSFCTADVGNFKQFRAKVI